MKKIIALAIGLVLLVACLCSCESVKTGNRIISGKDVQTFTYAYIKLGDKEIVEGPITQWRDYDNSDVVQVLIGGKYYLTHYSCCVLIADPSMGALNYSDPDFWGGEE